VSFLYRGISSSLEPIDAAQLLPRLPSLLCCALHFDDGDRVCCDLPHPVLMTRWSQLKECSNARLEALSVNVPDAPGKPDSWLTHLAQRTVFPRLRSAYMTVGCSQSMVHYDDRVPGSTAASDYRTWLDMIDAYTLEAQEKGDTW
jgi:hypothetical protein